MLGSDIDSKIVEHIFVHAISPMEALAYTLVYDEDMTKDGALMMMKERLGLDVRRRALDAYLFRARNKLCQEEEEE